jgi:uncharacterized protein HemX
MKKFITKAIICLSISVSTASVFAFEEVYLSIALPGLLTLAPIVDSTTGEATIHPMVLIAAAPVLGSTVYTAATVTVVLLLKQDQINDLLERAETENEMSSELKSIVEQIQADFKAKSGAEISDEEVLSQLQAQII